MGTDGLNDWSEIDIAIRLVLDRLGLALGFLTLYFRIIKYCVNLCTSCSTYM